MTVASLAVFVLGAIAALAVLTLVIARLITLAGAILMGWLFKHY